jgi:hypothetical protein
MPSFREIAAVSAAAAMLLSAPGAVSGSGEHTHGHTAKHGEMREAPADSAPAISIEAIADPSDGYNLHLQVEGFAFSPRRTGHKTDALEGHAHLYVNDVKIGRVYGPWLHLPAKLLAPGTNLVRVSLNDNTHSPLALDGQPLEAVIELPGPAGEAAARDVDNITVHVKDDMNANVVGVERGTRVNLTVHGAGENQLHLHGYDISFASIPALASFDAEHAGRFALEMHTEADLLGRSERTILYIEVR